MTCYLNASNHIYMVLAVQGLIPGGGGHFEIHHIASWNRSNVSFACTGHACYTSSKNNSNEFAYSAATLTTADTMCWVVFRTSFTDTVSGRKIYFRHWIIKRCWQWTKWIQRKIFLSHSQIHRQTAKWTTFTSSEYMLRVKSKYN